MLQSTDQEMWGDTNMCPQFMVNYSSKRPSSEGGSLNFSEWSEGYTVD